MRLLHVLEPSDGGVAKHVLDLTAELLARGHEVDAVVASRHGYPEALSALGAGVAVADFRPEITALSADARALRRLVGLMRQRRWDVVHTHGNKGGLLGRTAAAVTGLPVVHSAHGFAYLGQLRRERRAMTARRSLTLNVERALAPLAEVIVCVSEDERRAAIDDHLAAPQRLVVVRNGVRLPPPAEPDRRLVAAGDDRPLVGYLARLAPEKGPLLFVDALAGLRRRGIDFRAAMVGDGPLRDAVADRIRAAGLDSDVALLPWPGTPYPVLSALDVYVLPSLMESLPIGVLEAMAVGRPVVAADVGGVREAVLHGRTGLLFEPADLAGLEDALERMLADPAARASMGAAGRAHCEREFTFEAMVDGLETAYRRARSRRFSSASP